MAQEGPKTAQEDLKMAQEGTKTAQEGPKRPQECTMRAEDGSKIAQESPKRRTRELQKGPHLLPKECQDGPGTPIWPKRAPGRSKMAQKSSRAAQQGPKTAQLRNHFGLRPALRGRAVGCVLMAEAVSQGRPDGLEQMAPI